MGVKLKKIRANRSVEQNKETVKKWKDEDKSTMCRATRLQNTNFIYSLYIFALQLLFNTIGDALSIVLIKLI